MEQLENLFTAARNARATLDSETAIKHYEEISALQPNSWEALFYLAVLKTNNIKYGEISNAAISIQNCLPRVFELINETIDDELLKKNAIKEVVNQCENTASWLKSVSGAYYDALTKQKNISVSILDVAMNMDSKRNARYESVERMSKVGNILCLCGNLIENIFGLKDKFYNELAIECWKEMLNYHFEHIKTYKVAMFDNASVQRFTEKIKSFDSSYEVPNIKPTEVRDYTIKGIIIALISLGIGLLIAWPMLRLYL